MIYKALGALSVLLLLGCTSAKTQPRSAQPATACAITIRVEMDSWDIAPITTTTKFWQVIVTYPHGLAQSMNLADVVLDECVTIDASFLKDGENTEEGVIAWVKNCVSQAVGPTVAELAKYEVTALPPEWNKEP